MAVKWGEAEIEVHVDGHTLPEETRAVAASAGRIGGDSFNKSFAQRLRQGLSNTFNRIKGWFTGLWGRLFRRGGKNLGDGFTDGFKDSMKTFKLEFDKVTTDIAKRSSEVDFSRWGDDLGNLRQVFPEITDGFRQLAIEGNKGLKVWEPMIEDIGELRQVFDETGDSAQDTSRDFRILWRELEAGSGATEDTSRKTHRLRDSMEKLRSSFRGFGDAIKNGWAGLRRFSDGMDGITSAGNRQGSMWKRLSANTRQWTLIIAAVIGAMGDLAGLASAAGSGLFVMVGALAGLVTGGLLTAVMFSNLIADIEKMPPALRSARKAFDLFRDSINKAMDAMSVEAFRGTEKSWKKLAKVVDDLTPGFTAVAKVVNRLIKDLAKNLDTSTVENLNKFLGMSATVLDRVVRMVGRLADALLEAFARPSFQRALEGFLGYLDLLIDRFSDFLTGPGFDEWLAHGEDIFGSFGRLLDTTGRLLNDMVTDETVRQLTNFIDNIDRFLQHGGKGILDFAQELDVFGLLAQMLADFGDALEPLAGPMSDLAEAINDVVRSGIKTLAPIIEDLAEALAPLVQGLADFIKANPQLVANGLMAIWGAMAVMKIGKITGLATAFLALTGNVDALTKVKNLAKTAGLLVGLSLAIGALGAVFTGGESPIQGLLDLESSLTDFVVGFGLIGARFGPIGAAIGASLGLITGYITDFEGATNESGLNLLGMFTGGPWGQWGAIVLDFFAGLVPEEWKTSENPFEQFVAAFAESTTNFGTTVVNFNTEWGKIFDGKDEDAGELETLIDTMLKTIATSFETWKTDVIEDWTATWDALDNPAFWNIIADQIGTWIAGIIDDFRINLSTALTLWNTFWTSANKPNYWNIIGTAVSIWLGNIKMGFATNLTSAMLTWQAFWGNLPAIVNGVKSQVLTTVSGWFTQMRFLFLNFPAIVKGAWNSFWGGLLGPVISAVTSIISWVQRLVGPIADALGRLGAFIGQANNAASAGSRARAGGAEFAAGGILTGPRRILAGEAGPEAIVPLRRPLGQVSPDVRALSAIAQGISMPGSSGGGNGGAARTLNIQPGAIVIQGDRDPNRTALGIVNRLAERAAS